MTVDVRPKILIVEDDRDMRRLLHATLQDDYLVEQAGTGYEALELLPVFVPDIVLLDLVMPGIDGYETCRRISRAPAAAVPQIIIVSTRSSRQQQLRAYEAGADDYVAKPFDVHDLLARIALHVRLRAARHQAATIQKQIESRNSELRRVAEQRAQDIVAVQDIAVLTLAKLAESRDPETGGHLIRIREYSQAIAEQLVHQGRYTEHITAQFLQDLYRASPLHDIGKIGIPDYILLKPGRLTAEEFAIMQQHAVLGANILDQAVTHANIGGFLAMAATVARFHHERFDGSGYPTGLVGEQIPLPARIVALADVYDAITSKRPYKPAHSPAEARDIIRRDSAKHFDPAIVSAFDTCFSRFVDMQQQFLGDAFSVQGTYRILDTCASARSGQSHVITVPDLSLMASLEA